MVASCPVCPTARKKLIGLHCNSRTCDWFYCKNCGYYFDRNGHSYKKKDR